MPGHSRLPAEQPDYKIRQAAPADVPELMRLEADRFTSDRISRRSFTALIRSPSASVIAADHGGRLIGYALLLTRRGGRSGRLYSIAVAADEAGRGVGSRLLDAVEAAARQRGLPRMHLEVRADNPSAIGLYERAGYKPAGRRPGYYEDGTDALLYSRRLQIFTSRPVSTRLKRAA